jgi:hypothetical protein
VSNPNSQSIGRVTQIDAYTISFLVIIMFLSDTKKNNFLFFFLRRVNHFSTCFHLHVRPFKFSLRLVQHDFDKMMIVSNLKQCFNLYHHFFKFSLLIGSAHDICKMNFSSLRSDMLRWCSHARKFLIACEFFSLKFSTFLIKFFLRFKITC